VTRPFRRAGAYYIVYGYGPRMIHESDWPAWRRRQEKWYGDRFVEER